MIYLRNTIEWQTIRIPRNGIEELPTEAVFILRNSVAHTKAYEIEVTIPVSAGLYHAVDVALPAGLKDGEYTYKLTTDGMILSEGVAQIGFYTPATASGDAEIKFKQAK